MADRYAIKTGNWNDATVWSATSGGAGGASVPTAGDSVYMGESGNSYTLTLTGDQQCDFFEIDGGNLKLSGYTLTINQAFSALNDSSVDISYSKIITSATSNQSSPVYFDSTVSLTVPDSLIELNFGFAPNASFDTQSFTFNDVVINLGVGGSYSDVLSITGSPTFRLLDIRSANSAAHTVFFDSGSTVTVNKLVAIGSSASNKLTIAPASGSSTIAFTSAGTSYGQYVAMAAYSSGAGVPKYIGSNSTAPGGSTGWLTQDPPKISTLVDPLTTAPGSNTNWTVTGTGTVTQVTTGHDGGGYKLASGASIVSTNTYDLTDSEVVFERPTETATSGSFGISGLGEIGYFTEKPRDVGVWSSIFGTTPVGDTSYYDLSDTDRSGAQNFTYPLSNSAYIKLRIDGTTLIRQSSIDGAAWQSKSPVTINNSDLMLFKSARVLGLNSSGTQAVGSINPSLNAPPAVALNSPSNATQLTTTTPALSFTGTDPDGDTVTYEVQVANNSSFTSPLTDALSASSAGFSGTNPYASGTSVTYTVQTALTAGGLTYYWRVRAKDPSGSNSWGDWSATRTMITEAISPTVTSGSSSSVTINSATAAGNVTSDGGATITQRGIVYGTTSNPTTSGSKVTANGTTGSFTANLAGLSSNTTYHWRAYAINSKGTSYGSDQTFTTPPKPPVVSTGTAAGTTTSSFTVTSSGVTSNPDSQTINEYGVVYSTSPNPIIADSSQTGTGTSASYNDTLSSLTENTTYYVRAYAKWGGTNYAYGSQVTYKTQQRPVVTLDSPSNNGTTSDTKPSLKFTGLDSDNDNITYQLQLNSTNSFTTPLLDKLSASDTGFSNLSTTKTDPFYAGNQIQYAVATDLTRGQDYYWRVRGKDATGSNTWGNWTTAAMFTVSAILASLTTNGASNITFNTADVAVTVNSGGGAAITERGVVWSTSTNPTTTDTKVTDGGTNSTYSVTLTGLSGGTTYYARAYAINAVGTAYGNNISFQTSQTPAAPTVVTGAAAFMTDITSQFNGNQVTQDGTFTVTERGIVFSDTNTTPDTNDRTVVAPSAGLGSYDLNMTGLDASTTYFVRAYAVNSYGTGYGDVVSFTTQAPFVPDEGDGYWSWSPGQSQATVGRTQATPAYSSVNLPLEDLNLTNGTDYTFYFGSVDADQGAPSVELERFDDTTAVTDVITAGTPFTFTYDETLIHWNIRLFVTDATAEADNITAVFNDLYLAQESTFSGYVPFIRRGITERKLINNEIVDDRRDDVISSIFDQVNGVSWYPFNIDTEGLGYFEVGDRFTIIDDQGDSKSVVVWNTKLTVDGGISENLYTNKPDLTETDYTKAGNSKLRGNIRQTKLQVDKQQGTIDALVSDMYNYDGVVNTKYTELLQDNESIIATVQGAGGVNLLKNSVMYAFDDSNVPNSWTVTGAGTLTIQASPESLAAGAVSGNQFTLSDITATQTVTVRKDVDFIAEDEKTYYSISARVKKNTVGTASITLTNRNETLTIDLPDQTSYFWDVVSIEGILPKDDHYDIAITSDADADLQVTDVILAPGKTRHEWTQANGENMNSSVAVTEDGITIRSSAFKNNYTHIDALGFEVHKQEAGGERIFGFNDDETNVSKLKADKQISMSPMRIVPVDYSTYKGIAFTHSEDN